MCFSASASFGASAIVGTIGIVALTKVKEQQHVPFAIIPLMFSVQQLAEGMLWIGLSDPAHSSWQHFPVYIFLIFAQLIWPVWVPFSILLLEKDRMRGRWLSFLLAMGLTISLYLLYCLFVYDVSAEISSGHIRYNLDFPTGLIWISGVLYFMPTVFSLFVSSVKWMSFLGIAILISFIITRIFFEEHLISVWCFFAAILSLIILGITATFTKQTGHPVMGIVK